MGTVLSTLEQAYKHATFAEVILENCIGSERQRMREAYQQHLCRLGNPELPGYVTLLCGLVEQALIDVSEQIEADADEFDVMSPAMLDLVLYRARSLIEAVKVACTDTLHVRVQARRVEWAAERLGVGCPLGADRILADDDEASFEADNEAYRTWCEARGIEWLEIRGDQVRIGTPESSVTRRLSVAWFAGGSTRPEVEPSG